MSAITKIGHYAIAALFIWMSIIQFNDPDPIYWVIVYASVAIVAVMASFRYQNSWFLFVSFGLVLAGLLISASGFIDYFQAGQYSLLTTEMQDSKPYIESAREFIGLLMAASALTFYAGQAGKTT